MKKGLFLVTLLGGIFSLCYSQSNDTWTVSSAATWIEAVNGIRSGGNSKDYTITIAGNVSVPPPPSSENTFGSITNITITIEGNGSLSPSSNGVLLNMGTGQTIIAKNVTFRGRSGNDYSVVFVGEGSIFHMEGNASVTGNGGGGGVCVQGGTFIMRDSAAVKGNTMISIQDYGGGGVWVNDAGTFSMEGNSTVTDNKVIGESVNEPGGGVWNNGTFTMKDNASVKNNSILNSRLSTGVYTTTSDGGGIYNGGTLIMQGNSLVAGNSVDAPHGASRGGGIFNEGTFTIQDNATVTANISSSTYGQSGGGGVYNMDTFVMQGSASVSGNTAFSGGGISNYGTFNMKDTTSVLNNICSKEVYSSTGGGVYVGSGTFTIQDKALVSGNTAFSGGGVWVDYGRNNKNPGTFIMQGNSSLSGNNASWNGGGVYIFSGICSIQENAIILNNTATYYGGGVYNNNGTFTKTGGIVYGDDVEQNKINNVVSRFGNAIYDDATGSWRNATAGITTNSDLYGFWLNDGDFAKFPFAKNVQDRTWKRSNFNNILTLTQNTIKSSSSNNLWILQNISGNVYTFKRSKASNTLTITIVLVDNNKLVISGDKGSDQDNWNGTWLLQ